jgi:hypothetical protein
MLNFVILSVVAPWETNDTTIITITLKNASLGITTLNAKCRYAECRGAIQKNYKNREIKRRGSEVFKNV